MVLVILESRAQSEKAKIFGVHPKTHFVSFFPD